MYTCTCNSTLYDEFSLAGEIKESAISLHKDKRNGVDGKNQPFTPEKTGDPAGKTFNPAIFPGTKWCGLNNIATSYNDLGMYAALQI